MYITGAMDDQNWITSIIALWVNIYFENAVKLSFYSFCRTSNVEISLPFILGHLRGLRFVGAIYPFYLRKKIESKILWKEFGLLLFKYCLKKGPTFRWICQLNMSVRWSIQIEKIGSAYIYIHISYISCTYHMHMTLVVPSRQCLFTYYYEPILVAMLFLPYSMPVSSMCRNPGKSRLCKGGFVTIQNTGYSAKGEITH